MTEHLRLWRYRVPPEKRKEFVHHYSSEGTWVQLFQRADGYLGTSLWQDASDENVFYTLDRWRDAASFESFQQHYSGVYKEMDKQLEGLATDEEFLGACNSVQP